MSLDQTYAVSLMEHLVVPTFVLSPAGQVVIWNRACERLTGVTASEVVGTDRHWQAFYIKKRQCLADLVVMAQTDKLADLYPEHSISNDGLSFSAENWCVMPKLGNQLYLAIDAGPVRDERGNLIAVVETLRDMTDQKRAENALKRLAAVDGLTGLANRRSFDQTLAIEWTRAKAARKPLSLLFADVDYFKLYNDLHGHQKGDECLRAVADALANSRSRPADLSARYGGEEFVVIMPATGQDVAYRIADNLREVVERLRIVHGARGADEFVTLSIGVATQFPKKGHTSDRLLTEADQALYIAKRCGRNRVISANNALAELAKAGKTRSCAILARAK